MVHDIDLWKNYEFISFHLWEKIFEHVKHWLLNKDCTSIGGLTASVVTCRVSGRSSWLTTFSSSRALLASTLIWIFICRFKCHFERKFFEHVKHEWPAAIVFVLFLGLSWMPLLVLGNADMISFLTWSLVLGIAVMISLLTWSSSFCDEMRTHHSWSPRRGHPVCWILLVAVPPQLVLMRCVECILDTSCSGLQLIVPF